MDTAKKIKDLLNNFGRERTPILFVIDFDLQNFYISPLEQLDNSIRFQMDSLDTPLSKDSASEYPVKHSGSRKREKRKVNTNSFVLTASHGEAYMPSGIAYARMGASLSYLSGYSGKTSTKVPYSYKAVSKERYKKAFDEIIEEIKAGNTYLTNLTFRSKLFIDYSLEEIYEYSDARFKLLFFDKFVTFTPERFVKIENNTIYTHPMKGTIDAKIPNAQEKILSNQKEMAEHTMVVDLLRNDLSIVATKVRVDRFRYVEKIKAGERELLQVSSEISGQLESEWQDRLGDILVSMLPAGSITGTPKKSTTEIIKRVEGYERGYYSGVFGVFDGDTVDSAVMIRFVEKAGDQLYYKSGGGITIDSDWKSEYNEMCEKIYVPFV